MRRLDDTPIDPEIAACLDAIDATLAGEPVDPRHAEIAELALLVADERPRPRPEFTAALDARVARRFASTPAPGPAGAPGPARPRHATRGPWRAWALSGAAATCLAAVIIAIAIVGSGGPGASSGGVKSPGVSASSAGSSSSSSSSSSSASSAAAPSAHERAAHAPSGNLAAAAAPHAAAGGGAQSLTPAPNGRKIVQSAELDLSTSPNDIGAVAQQVFNVVGNAQGIVDHSAVTQTGGLDGSATFQLRLPSDTLGQTLARLSDLRDAKVLSRTDNSQDVNSQYVSTTNALADAQALRTSLLKQLAAATTTGEIDSLKARLHDAETTIASDQAALRALNSQINYSRVTVTISAVNAPPAPAHHSGGFGIGRAAHVAGRVLVVAAGVGLIALAALAPVALVAALLAWLGFMLRRRRREQALDLA